MTLKESVSRLLDFSSWSYADQIRYFCWYLHAQKKQDTLQPADVRNCFDELRMEPPANVNRYFGAMTERSPKELLKDKKGYRLERKLSDELDGRFAQSPSTIAVTDALASLPSKIAGLAEREYISEALICFKHRAFRASIVMAWNLAYDYFVGWILVDANRLAEFNARLAKQTNPGVPQIKTRDDFTHLKESLVISLARKIISEGQYKVLDEKLAKRNAVAHPGGLVVNDVTAEEFIRDLIDNIMLKLS